MDEGLLGKSEQNLDHINQRFLMGGTDLTHRLWQSRYEHCARSAGYIFGTPFTTQ